MREWSLSKCPYCGQAIEAGRAKEVGGLTKRQAALLEWLRKWDWSKQISPSYDEMGKGIGLKSKSGIHRLVHGLVNRGFITFRKNAFTSSTLARSITLLTPTKE